MDVKTEKVGVEDSLTFQLKQAALIDGNGLFLPIAYLAKQVARMV